MEQKEFYKQLVSRYAQNTANVDELEVFFQLMKEGKLDEYITDEMITAGEVIMGPESIKKIKPTPVRSVAAWIRVAAASVILLLLAGVFYFSNKEADQGKTVVKETPSPLLKSDILPGGNKAVLTLADGSTIILDSVQNGTLSNQGNIKVIKLDDGQLAYDKSGVSASPQLLYNTISTPKGGQYQLTLSDGSKVWLNAASSLRFPASFSGKERKVELTGEGYFEVAHNTNMPFNVRVNDMEVQVLGTHFNINAYEDETSVKTTLLEGSVKVSEGNKNVIIRPGQQVWDVKGNNELLVKKDVDIESVIAWKNGYFYFENATIKEIMRQLSRWYNVDVVYDGQPPAGHYRGKPSRHLHLQEIIKVIELSGVKISVNNKTIIVKE